MSASMMIVTFCQACHRNRLLPMLRKHVRPSNTFQRRCFSGRNVDIRLKNGRLICQFEFGKLAKFADGSVVATDGDTSVLVTAVCSKTPPEQSQNFLPLTVDYRQKYAAASRIPTNHLRRELGPTEREILTGRVIDRSLRPMFPKTFFYDTQITVNLLSIDGIHDPEVLSINAASAALHVSNIPWDGPVGAVRIACIDNKSIIINPTRKELQKSIFDVIVVADTNEKVVMLEGEAKNVASDLFIQGITVGAETATKIARSIPEPKTKRYYQSPSEVPRYMMSDIERTGGKLIEDELNNKQHDKVSRDVALNDVRKQVINKISGNHSNDHLLNEGFNKLLKNLLRQQILDSEIRCDGRELEQVRPISAGVDLYKPLHGSALFQRGQTQVLCTVTFDSRQATLKADPMSVLTGSALKEKYFMLHYEFPAYATNEIKMDRAKSNRRELGHGALAEKGLKAIIPDEFPFSIRLTSEVLESNGSSSMASICGGTLALMDAGVSITEPAAGVAMGLVTREIEDPDPTELFADENFAVIDDLLGIEDYFGDMDLKVGGTKSGITAIQMDLKLPGIPMRVLYEALDRANERISEIIDTMLHAAKITKPRDGIKKNGPKTEFLELPATDRSMFIGVGGKNIQRLQEQTGVKVTSLDSNRFEIFAPHSDNMEDAQTMIKTFLTREIKAPELEFKAIYECKITEIKETGIMLQMHPAMDPVYMANSQIDHRQISHASALGMKEGDLISVQYFGRDQATGKHRVSRKVITGPASKTYRFINET